ncbi:uncharacterized protein PAC_06245 [Phialocephala subalpina]|uniref:Uncharacterized protein n=1 Tax=Phialocephala subalpina TaxID=576137 RepID=A0A1L7WUB2_9HELO|nr:uncharacterized protein PAC_06245 [Phialocephala subalpina]
MAADLTQAFEALITNIRNLASDDSYKAIEGVFDKVPRLEGLIESKDIELGNLRNEIIELKSRQEDRIQEDLERYRKQRNNLEEEKAALAGIISTLEATIKQKDVASTEHTRTQTALQGQLDEVTKFLGAEKDKVAAANEDITKLHLQNENTQNAEAKTTIQDLREKIASLEGDLQSSTTRLDEIESFTTKLQEGHETVWIKRLDEVWDVACSVVASLFEEDLVEERLRDRSAWEDLRESRYLERAIPLPRSNSPTAKQMRIAALLAILARSIAQHVFQPIYILEGKDERDEIRELLVHLAITDSKKESFCRALLLSIFPGDQTINGTKAIKEVLKCVRNLVSDAQYESFRLGVEDIAQKAQEAWRLVQGTKEKFEVYFELNHYVDLEWQLLNFDDGRVSVGDESTVTAKGDEALLMVFPRIYIIADSEPDPVTRGVVLMKSQSTPAVEEMERNNPPSPTTARAGLRSRAFRSRGMSPSVNGANGFLSQPIPPGVR